MKKAVLYLVLTLALCLSLALPASAASFTDIKSGDYYYVPVLWAVEQGIASGTSGTTFSPKETCTIAQILTFLWRANGQPVSAGPNPFTDVAETDYFAPAALWASEKGLVSGTSLAPKSPCTRSMVVTYLWKLSGSPEAGSPAFTDVPADAVYAEAVAWAVEQEITGGTDSNSFSPEQACTRGQIVTFLYRYSGSPAVDIPEEKPTVTPYANFPSVPDFGAFFCVSPMDSKVEENAHYFYYDPVEVATKNPNQDIQALLSEYEELLTTNGFSLLHAYMADEGPVAAYTNSDTAFSMGVNSESGQIAILVRPLSDITSNFTSDDGKYYSAYPGVPDFGAATGVLPVEVSPRADGDLTYIYNTANVSKDQNDKWTKMLADEGFVITDAGVNSVGMAYAEITKGNISILVVESGTTLTIAIYS